MKQQLVLTVIGPDRPGLVRAIAHEVVSAGGDWLESRMATLAGTFAGVVLVAVPHERADALGARLQALQSQGLRVGVEVGSADPLPVSGRLLQLELLGQDRPGIVREVTHLLAERQVSVEELETDTISGAFSGETLFRARARLRVPAALPTEALRGLLEDLANELMVDVNLEEPEHTAPAAGVPR